MSWKTQSWYFTLIKPDKKYKRGVLECHKQWDWNAHKESMITNKKYNKLSKQVNTNQNQNKEW